MPRDKTLSHEKVKKAIKEEFLEKGFEGASIRSIGARAGMTSAGLYRHYSDKEAMFNAMVEPLIESRSIFKLSGGEKQKIACASIAVEPIDIVILDEPSANLDFAGICELQRMIESWKEEHKTILIAEHRISYLFPYITRALLMDDGEIIKEYTADEIGALSEEELHRLGLRAEGMQNPADINIDTKDAKNAHDKMILSNMSYSYKDEQPLSLSGGQKQRVAVASAIASGRNIILFDEPTSGLDYSHMLQVSELLKKLRDKGKTVIIVTHDIELIKNACTVVIPFACL